MDTDGTLGCDLTTHDGRLAFIRKCRDFVTPDELAQARTQDPFPVFWFESGPAGKCSTRAQALDWLAGGYDSELTDLLRADGHPPGTVFYIAIHGRQHSFLRSVIQLCGQG